MASPSEMALSIVQALVDQPDRVSVRWVEVAEGPYVEITSDPGDRGKIIGKRGRTIDSLRTILTAVFGKSDEKIGVELKE